MSNINMIMTKIDEGTITANDFQLLLDSMPETVRDRVRRRTLLSTPETHRDNETGHAKLSLPNNDARIKPKREKEPNSQRLGRGRLGHRHSARTQKRTMPKRFSEAFEFISSNIGKDVNDLQLENVTSKPLLLAAATRMMSVPNINRDWLDNLCSILRTENERDR